MLEEKKRRGKENFLDILSERFLSFYFEGLDEINKVHFFLPLEPLLTFH